MAVGEIKKCVTSIIKTVECPICLEFLNDPVSTACNHRFCRKCIITTLNEKFTASCPICKSKVTKRQLKETGKLSKIIHVVKQLSRVIEEDIFTASQNVISPSLTQIVDVKPLSEDKNSLFADCLPLKRKRNKETVNEKKNQVPKTDINNEKKENKNNESYADKNGKIGIEDGKPKITTVINVRSEPPTPIKRLTRRNMSLLSIKNYFGCNFTKKSDKKKVITKSNKITEYKENSPLSYHSKQTTRCNALHYEKMKNKHENLKNYDLVIVKTSENPKLSKIKIRRKICISDKAINMNTCDDKIKPDTISEVRSSPVKKSGVFTVNKLEENVKNNCSFINNKLDTHQPVYVEKSDVIEIANKQNKIFKLKYNEENVNQEDRNSQFSQIEDPYNFISSQNSTKNTKKRKRKIGKNRSRKRSSVLVNKIIDASCTFLGQTAKKRQHDIALICNDLEDNHVNSKKICTRLNNCSEENEGSLFVTPALDIDHLKEFKNTNVKNVNEDASLVETRNLRKSRNKKENSQNKSCLPSVDEKISDWVDEISRVEEFPLNIIKIASEKSDCTTSLSVITREYAEDNETGKMKLKQINEKLNVSNSDIITVKHQNNEMQFVDDNVKCKSPDNWLTESKNHKFLDVDKQKELTYGCPCVKQMDKDFAAKENDFVPRKKIENLPLEFTNGINIDSQETETFTCSASNGVYIEDATQNSRSNVSVLNDNGKTLMTVHEEEKLLLGNNLTRPNNYPETAKENFEIVEKPSEQITPQCNYYDSKLLAKKKSSRKESSNYEETPDEVHSNLSLENGIDDKNDHCANNIDSPVIITNTYTVNSECVITENQKSSIEQTCTDGPLTSAVPGTPLLNNISKLLYCAHEEGTSKIPENNQCNTLFENAANNKIFVKESNMQTEVEKYNEEIISEKINKVDEENMKENDNEVEIIDFKKPKRKTFSLETETQDLEELAQLNQHNTLDLLTEICNDFVNSSCKEKDNKELQMEKNRSVDSDEIFENKEGHMNGYDKNIKSSECSENKENTIENFNDNSSSNTKRHSLIIHKNDQPEIQCNTKNNNPSYVCNDFKNSDAIQTNECMWSDTQNSKEINSINSDNHQLDSKLEKKGNDTQNSVSLADNISSLSTRCSEADSNVVPDENISNMSQNIDIAIPIENATEIGNSQFKIIVNTNCPGCHHKIILLRTDSNLVLRFTGNEQCNEFPPELNTNMKKEDDKFQIIENKVINDIQDNLIQEDTQQRNINCDQHYSDGLENVVSSMMENIPKTIQIENFQNIVENEAVSQEDNAQVKQTTGNQHTYIISDLEDLLPVLTTEKKNCDQSLSDNNSVDKEQSITSLKNKNMGDFERSDRLDNDENCEIIIDEEMSEEIDPFCYRQNRSIMSTNQHLEKILNEMSCPSNDPDMVFAESLVAPLKAIQQSQYENKSIDNVLINSSAPTKIVGKKLLDYLSISVKSSNNMKTPNITSEPVLSQKPSKPKKVFHRIQEISESESDNESDEKILQNTVQIGKLEHSNSVLNKEILVKHSYDKNEMIENSDAEMKKAHPESSTFEDTEIKKNEKKATQVTHMTDSSEVCSTQDVHHSEVKEKIRLEIEQMKEQIRQMEIQLQTSVCGSLSDDIDKSFSKSYDDGDNKIQTADIDYSSGEDSDDLFSPIPPTPEHK